MWSEKVLLLSSSSSSFFLLNVMIWWCCCFCWFCGNFLILVLYFPFKFIYAIMLWWFLEILYFFGRNFLFSWCCWNSSKHIQQFRVVFSMINNWLLSVLKCFSFNFYKLNFYGVISIKHSFLKNAKVFKLLAFFCDSYKIF